MVRFIDNTCSDEELHTVERWLAESPENSRRLFELERTAMLAGSLRNDSRTRNRVYTKSRSASRRKRHCAGAHAAFHSSDGERRQP